MTQMNNCWNDDGDNDDCDNNDDGNNNDDEVKLFSSISYIRIRVITQKGFVMKSIYSLYVIFPVFFRLVDKGLRTDS